MTCEDMSDLKALLDKIRASLGEASLDARAEELAGGWVVDIFHEGKHAAVWAPKNPKHPVVLHKPEPLGEGEWGSLEHGQVAIVQEEVGLVGTIMARWFAKS